MIENKRAISKQQGKFKTSKTKISMKKINVMRQKEKLLCCIPYDVLR